MKKSAIIRKSMSAGKQLPRLARRALSKDEDFRIHPPVIANSFPKSGTHLLVQILQALPNTTNYGSFIASTPTLTFQERTLKAHKRLIRRIVPGELVTAHLFYDEEHHKALDDRNCAHFFIYRDPRDVAVSEAYYLTYMNKWHRMHKYYAQLTNMDERISTAILGVADPNFPYVYPDIASRFRRYEGWLNHPDVFSVRFEELVTGNQRDKISEIIKFFAERASRNLEIDRIVEAALLGIDPARSHTFREGKVGKWREIFTERHKQEMKAVGGELLVKLSYESDTNW